MTTAIAITILAMIAGLAVLVMIQKQQMPRIYRYCAILFTTLAFLYNMCLMTRGIIIHNRVKDITTETEIKEH